MRAILCALLAAIALSACTRVVIPPTAKTATYTGPRTRGYPTPLLVREVPLDDSSRVAVLARGTPEEVTRVYVAAWELDGWAANPGEVEGRVATLGMRRSTENRTILFTPHTEGGASSVLVLIEGASSP